MSLSSGQTILAVDDAPANLSVLAELLGERYRVKIATNGARALDLALSEPPDLILLDVMMPRLNGYEVLERIHGNARLRHIPVIVISAVDELESVIRCIQLGAEDYLTKPINPVLLHARVGASLEKKALRDQIYEWNQKLEQRVQEQLAQLDRLGRLKGFFSPHLAELIVDGGGEGLLKAHRREVVVAFLDLRGFTAFTDTSEPEEVMGLLAEYHQAMGKLILSHEGTLEHFTGDGIMIFFNDPIPLANPIDNAVRMAVAMQRDFTALCTAWERRGYGLGLGIGIAQGYATLGAIGFEGRWDYACIGGIVNLASRLCSEAKNGQILTNQRTLAGIEDKVQSESLGEIVFKGFSNPVPVHNITGLRNG